MDDHVVRDTLARGMRILANEVAPDNRGHVSYRPPGEDRAYIIGRLHVLGRAMSSTTYDDVVTIDLDAKLLEGRFPAPDESIMHTAIYQARPDARAVVHVHPPKCIALSVVGQTLVPLSLTPFTLKLFGDGPVSLFDKARLIDTVELANEVAEMLGKSRAIMLRGHGVAVMGQSIEEAVVTTIQLEALARLQYEAAVLGTVRPFDVEVLRTAASGQRSGGPDWAWQVWAYYEEELHAGRGPGDRR